LPCISGKFNEQLEQTACKECQQGRHDTAGSVQARDTPTVCEKCKLNYVTVRDFTQKHF
jgi:hypothetical protein